MSRPRSALRGALACLLLPALAGCVVGPNYKGPPPLPAVPSGAYAAPDASSGAPAGRWWRALNDPVLTELIEEALEKNLTLETARTRVLQARAALTKAKADALPTTQASGVYLRTKGLTNLLTGEAAVAAPGVAGETALAAGASSETGALQFYDVGFDATWELDLFGANARAREGARADFQARGADLDDAKVTLAAEVARSYVALRDRQTRLALAEESARLDEQMLALQELRRQGGTGTDLEVERLRAQLLAARAEAEPLRADLSASLNQLALLTGGLPGSLDAALSAPIPAPLPPALVTVGDPAGMLRRRPDLRAAERRLASRTAAIGLRTADYFPKLELLGNIGFGATDVSTLLNAGNFSYAVAPILQWRPFDFGRTRALVAEARLQRDEALASYREKVLEALEDAATALQRYGRERAALTSLLAVEASAGRTLALTTDRFRGGTATLLDTLQARSRETAAKADVAASRARLTDDFIALQKSLGLGWADGA